MVSLKGLLKRNSLPWAICAVVCLLIFSASVRPQIEKPRNVLAEKTNSRGIAEDPNSQETQRRIFAISLVISLATEARSYQDTALRPRILARAADALWEADNVTARSLFARAWDAAETGDAEGVTTNTKDNVPAMVIGLRKLSGSDLRLDVLTLASLRDRALGEQFLANLKTEKEREASNANSNISSRSAFSGSEASLKRLSVAKKLLAADEIAAAKEFASSALTEVNAHSIGFLSLLRAKDAVAADKIFSQLLVRTESDTNADANTISGLSSYAFTPGFYILFWADGHSTWMQPEEPTIAPNLDASLRARFFQVAANVLLRPVPPPDQDVSSCGRRGRLMVITRLLPLFELYAPEAATALRAQLTAREARNIDATSDLLTEGIRPEKNRAEIGDIEEQLGRARSTDERDQIYAAAAERLAPTGHKRARELADSIEDPELRARIQNYVDFEMIKLAIRKKKAAEVAQLAGAGELTHIQRSWSFTQAAGLLLEADRERALEMLEKASDEAARIDVADPDATFALINIARQFLALDRTRAWEVLNKLVKVANAAEDFTGDDIRMPKRAMLVTRNGTRFIHLPDTDFNFSRVLRVLAQDDLFRAIEVGKGFKHDSARSYATLAIARAILEKPKGVATVKK